LKEAKFDQLNWLWVITLHRYWPEEDDEDDAMMAGLMSKSGAE
jgi:hypothetical protein